MRKCWSILPSPYRMLIELLQGIKAGSDCFMILVPTQEESIYSDSAAPSMVRLAKRLCNLQSYR